MSDEKANEYEAHGLRCAHCLGLGSCKSGKDGTSCYVCLKAAKAKEPAHGLVCSVCHGRGYTVPMTEQLRERVGPMLALILCYLALALVFFAMGKPDFDKIIPFSATVIGSVTGFYFGARASKSRKE